MKYIIYTDGGSRGNPGPAGVGFVIYDEKGEILKKHGEAIGQATNNEAEYRALILALKKIKALFGKDKMKSAQIEIRMDSELIINQLSHKYKIEDAKMQLLFLQVWNLLIDFGSYDFISIPREQNSEADKLVNQALDLKQESLL